MMNKPLLPRCLLTFQLPHYIHRSEVWWMDGLFQTWRGLPRFDRAAACCDRVTGDESASVWEEEGSNEAMLIRLHQRALLMCSWHFGIAVLHEQLQTESAHVPRGQLQLWYFMCAHIWPASTRSSSVCGEISYKKKCLTREMHYPCFTLFSSHLLDQSDMH